MHSSLALRIPPLILLSITLVILWLLPQWAIVGDDNSVFLGWISAGLSVLAIFFVGSAVIQFRWQQTTVDPRHPESSVHLVTEGVYKLSRNPMYVGFVLFILAFGVWLNTWALLVITPLFVIYLNRFQIVPEELWLQDKFGQAYQAYCQRVRRWL